MKSIMIHLAPLISRRIHHTCSNIRKESMVCFTAISKIVGAEINLHIHSYNFIQAS